MSDNNGWRNYWHMDEQALKDALHDLAAKTVCPISEQPKTVYEIGAVRNLVQFGLMWMAHLSDDLGNGA